MKTAGITCVLAGLHLALAAGCATMGGAGASAEDMARAHWAAIANNDLGASTKDSAEGAVLDWVGGPLNGKYAGAMAIAGLWTKFSGAQGPLTVDISDVQVKDGYGKQTVTARTISKGKGAVPADYALTYEAGRIVGETWTIRP
jgi:hypothetical protein